MTRAREKSPVEEILADVEAHIDEWFHAKLPFSFRGGLRWTPATDVYETEREYRVMMAVPGLRTEDLSVQFEADTLRIRGVRRDPCGDQRHYHKMEIPVGPFERRVRVPRPIRAEEVTVTYRDGLVEVSLPKAPSGRLDVPIE
ncbi:MAG: Hsp20/alpha crystallin family protein [Gemmatimonadetes bacterium]|nr:Hsp20/alpha crystallin family protein [Gemmatimonadota bacterium]